MSTPSELCEMTEQALRVFRELKDGILTPQQAEILLKEMGLVTLANTLAEPVKAA